MEKEKRCCGNCCWFCFEQTDGEGQCMRVGYHGMPYGAFSYCGTSACKRHISRKEMRHYIAVLLQERRWQEWFEGRRDGEIKLPSADDVVKAREFSYLYMKTFSKL